MRTVAALLVVCLSSSGCVLQGRSASHVAYGANTAIIVAGAVLAGIALHDLDNPPPLVDEERHQINIFPGWDAMLLFSAGVVIVLAGLGGMAGTAIVNRELDCEADLRFALSTAPGPPDMTPASPVVTRLVQQTRIMAAAGYCEAARTAERKVKEMDPVTWARLLAPDPALRPCAAP